MELRIVVLVGVAAVTGWIARGVATGSPASSAVAAAAPVSPPRVVYVTAPAREEAPPPDEETDPEAGDVDGGEDVGELLARVQREAPPPPPEFPHNVITGFVTNVGATERFAGVTVVVTGPQLEGSRTAITDDSGEFWVPALPAGSYTVTFYYIDATVERSNVIVSSLRHTSLNAEIDTGSYLAKIPVPARTFESALAGEGVSFSGTMAMDSTYLVDGIDVTGLE